MINTRRTCESKHWAVWPAAREEVGHVASAGVDKNGPGAQAVGHGSRACADLLPFPPLQLLRQGLQYQLAMLFLPADPKFVGLCLIVGHISLH